MEFGLVLSSVVSELGNEVQCCQFQSRSKILVVQVTLASKHITLGKVLYQNFGNLALEPLKTPVRLVVGAPPRVLEMFVA